MNDRLIEGCLRQDRQAQKEVYSTLFGMVRAICRRYLTDKEDLIEVLNSTFLSVFRNIEQYDGKGNFEGWVKRIAINKSIDHLRSRKRFQEAHRLDPNLEDFNGRGVNDGPSSLAMEELDKMIESLPPMSRAVFNLFAIDDFAHKEIAEKLNITEATSRWHLSAARKQLRKVIAATEPEYWNSNAG